MEDVSQKLSLPKRLQKYVDRIILIESGYKVYLKKGYNNGRDGNTITVGSQRQLKRALEDVKVGLTKAEIREQAKLGSWEDQLSAYMNSAKKAGLQVIENLDSLLAEIDNEAKQQWNSHIEEHKSSEKALSSYKGCADYESYKAHHRMEEGFKSIHMALYGMSVKQREEVLQKYQNVTRLKLFREIERVVGQMREIEYVFQSDETTLTGKVEGEGGIAVFTLMRGTGLKGIDEGIRISVEKLR